MPEESKSARTLETMRLWILDLLYVFLKDLNLLKLTGLNFAFMQNA